MISEVQLGYSRRDSLRRLAQRTGLMEIRSFSGLVIQSDELGTSLVDLLRNFSADMRFRRLNRAERLAAQASTKMLIPLFLFIFPTVFILLLSPVIYDFFKQGLPF
jgi:tight adherence protein C